VCAPGQQWALSRHVSFLCPGSALCIPCVQGRAVHAHAPCPCHVCSAVHPMSVHSASHVSMCAVRCMCAVQCSAPMIHSWHIHVHLVHVHAHVHVHVHVHSHAHLVHVHVCIPWCTSIHGASLVHPCVHAICICVCHGTFWDILHSTPDVREVQSPPLPRGGVACGGVGCGAGPLRRVRSVCSGELPSSPERPSPSSKQSEWAAVMRPCGRS
jgi:hypothetical protein